MKQSSKCALGSIAAALSLTLMISAAIIPFQTYTLPAIAAIPVFFIVTECDKKWAFGVYATVALLSLILVPDKEISILYLTFFGYYPIVKKGLEKHLKKLISMIIKIIIFSVTISLSYLFMINLMGITIDETEEWGKNAYLILLGMGIFTFIMYDFCLTFFEIIYIKKWRNKLRIKC